MVLIATTSLAEATSSVPTQTITDVAGKNEIQITARSLYIPPYINGLMMSPSMTTMYITFGNSIARVNRVTQQVEIIAGKYSNSGFRGEDDLAENSVLELRNGTITTIAGTGNFNFQDPKIVYDGQLAVEADIDPRFVTMFDGEVYFSGLISGKIRKIVTNGSLVTVAGNELDFNITNGGEVSGLIATEKEIIFSSINTVLSVSRHNGIISTIAGTSLSNVLGDGGMANHALVNRPSKVFLGEGYMLVTEQIGGRIRRIFNNGTIITVAGGGNDFWKEGKVVMGDGGPAIKAALDSPNDVLEWNGEMYIADTNHGLIRKVDRNGIISTIAGNNEAFYMDNVAANMTKLNFPHAIRMDLNGELIISDTYNHRIRKVLKNNTIITIAGNGFEGYNGDGMEGVKTMLSAPKGLFITSENEILFADSGNGLIRKICKDGKVINVAGNGVFGFSGDNEKAIESQLYEPTDVIMNSHGELFIADSKNSKIRKVSRNGTITSIAGSGVSGYYQGNGNAILSKFNMPICLAERNDEIYVCDSYNNLIRKISPSCQQGWIYDQSSQMCLPMCFGLVNGNEKVCSGNGYCMANDVCKCDGLYFGSNCETSLLVVMIPILGGITGVSVLVILIVVLWYFYKNKKWIQRKKKESELDQKLLDYNDGNFSLDDSKISNGSSHIIPIEDIEFIKKIGEGGFGTVFKANWNKTVVAVKSISVSEAGTEEMEEFSKEAMLLNSLKHPNILSFFGICLSASKNLLVMEYLEEGSLDSLIQEWKLGRKKCKLDQKLKYMIDIANGMSYLHNLQPHPIIHRDLKPANILLNSSGQCKVCDFGMSRICSNKSATNLTCNIGTFFYMPNVSNNRMTMFLLEFRK